MKNWMVFAALLLFSEHASVVRAAPALQEEARPGAKQQGNAESGRKIAAMWCISCHKTAPTADDRIPSLTALVANPKTTDGALRSFLMQPHKPMPPLELGTQQIEDIIVYLRTLDPAPTPTR